MKDRITLTLDSELIEKIDQSIDGHKIKNRSHAIELLLMKAMKADMPTTALIIAGGKNKPLKKKFGETPHALTPIKEKPVLEHIIELFKKWGVTKIILSLHHDSEKIREHFEGKDLGIEIVFLEESFPLGTAGPVRLAKEHLNGTFFMCNADELKNVNLKKMYKFHKEYGGVATIALTTVDDPSEYGVANLTGNHILSFVEKPKKQNAPSNLINAGLYIMEPEVVDYIPQGFALLEQDVFPKLAKQNDLVGYSFSGQWFSLNNLEEYKEAENKWKGV